MDSKELRIGNYIKADDFRDLDLHPDEWVEVTSFSKEVVHWESSASIGGVCHSGTFNNDLKPIPLTEEWLVKFGFKETRNNKDSGYKEHELTQSGFTILFTTECNHFSECYLESIGIDIEFVHQLQNLYHSITSEELEIKG